MKMPPLTRKTLAARVAGRLAASLLDGSLPPGTHLPAERDLIDQLQVSRATLREAILFGAKHPVISALSNACRCGPRVVLCS